MCSFFESRADPPSMIVPAQPSFGIEYVDSQASLDTLLREMRRTGTVFLDLEADSMHHYYAKICLIQILVGEKCYLVDPLSGISLQGFLEELSKKVLVLHGADYDLRMLYQSSGFRPHQIFDTMLAAQLLGKPGFGLAALVQSYFNITLKKDQQKADWSLRPLPPLMLQYGAQDTFFLPGLYDHLTREMQEKNRLSWHQECCRELVKATATKKEVDLENSWRIEGSSRMTTRQLAVLQALWKFRDSVAKAQDLPSYKILPSDLLLRFSLAVPYEGDPPLLPGLPSRLNPKFKAGFLETLQAALELPPEQWPQPLKIPRRMTPSPSAPILAHLKTVRDRIAKELALDPSLLATKSTLTNVALTGASSRQKMISAAKWMQWQEDLLLEPWLSKGGEKVDRAERPEKIEKIEKIEKAEKAEKVEKADRDERPAEKGPTRGPDAPAPGRAWGRRSGP